MSPSYSCKCKSCGADVQYTCKNKYIVCPYCGTKKSNKDFIHTDFSDQFPSSAPFKVDGRIFEWKREVYPNGDIEWSLNFKKEYAKWDVSFSYEVTFYHKDGNILDDWSVELPYLSLNNKYYDETITSKKLLDEICKLNHPFLTELERIDEDDEYPLIARIIYNAIFNRKAYPDAEDEYIKLVERRMRPIRQRKVAEKTARLETERKYQKAETAKGLYFCVMVIGILVIIIPFCLMLFGNVSFEGFMTCLKIGGILGIGGLLGFLFFENRTL